MAKKKLGYVELEWACPICDTRNPGRARVCSGCGSPQPDNVEFHAPAHSEIIEDEETLAQATAGPDIHCPYCDARNAADAKVCKQCGGDLGDATIREAGRVIGAFDSTPAPDIVCEACGTANPATYERCQACGAPLPKPDESVTPEPVGAKGSSMPCGLIIAAVVVAVIVVFGVFIYLSSRTNAAQGTVVDARWQRSITIEGLVPVTEEDWRDQVPDQAENIQCRDEVRRTVDEPVPGAREVCGTPYTVDQGSGFAEVVQDCQYEIYDRMCTYTVDEWQEVDEMTVDGAGLLPEWPLLTLANDQREAERKATYTCVFSYNDRTYEYVMRSLDEFQACQPGTTWDIEINTFNMVVEAQQIRQ